MWNLVSLIALYAVSRIKTASPVKASLPPLSARVIVDRAGVQASFVPVLSVSAQKPILAGGVAGDFYSDPKIWAPPEGMALLSADVSGYINLENWIKWIQLPKYQDSIPMVRDLKYFDGSDTTVAFDITNVERKTPNVLLDIRMRLFGDLISIDDSGNYVPPVKFFVLGSYGFLPAGVVDAIEKSLAEVDSHFKNDNWQYIQAVRKMYFETVGYPASNLYHLAWTETIRSLDWQQRMLQAYYWYLLKKDRFKMTYRFFPLEEKVNEKTLNRSGLPKVSGDGVPLFVISTEDIAKKIMQNYVSGKLNAGKASILSKLGITLKN